MTITAADILKQVSEGRLGWAKVGVFDVDGVFRGKYMDAGKLASALEKGFGFCDVVLVLLRHKLAH